jgi:hypothetical protein
MALYRYFQPASVSLPDPRGLLSKKISSSIIVEANEAVSSVAMKQPAKRGTYAKFTVAQFASMHRIAAAKRRFSKELHADLKDTYLEDKVLGGNKPQKTVSCASRGRGS